MFGYVCTITTAISISISISIPIPIPIPTPISSTVFTPHSWNPHGTGANVSWTTSSPNAPLTSTPPHMSPTCEWAGYVLILLVMNVVMAMEKGKDVMVMVMDMLVMVII